MTRELPPDDPSFPYEEQYAAAAWRSTMQTLELVGHEIKSSYLFSDVPPSIAKLSRIALKNCESLLTSVETAIVKRNSYYNDFERLGLVAKDGRQVEVNPHLSAMTMFYHAPDAPSRELFSHYDMDRFDEDIEILTDTNFRTLRETQRIGAVRWLSTIRQLHHDSTFYIGKWDNDRYLGVDSDKNV